MVKLPKPWHWRRGVHGFRDKIKDCCCVLHGIGLGLPWGFSEAGVGDCLCEKLFDFWVLQRVFEQAPCLDILKLYKV